MRNCEEDSQIKTVFCGNLSEEVTDSILFELFNQAGPVEAVRRPKDQNGRPKSFGFVVFKHEFSVPYAVELFKGTKLFNRIINVNSRDNHFLHVPVLDTHLTEFTGHPGSESGRSHNWEEDRRSYRGHRTEHNNRRHNSKDDRNKNKASSWSELKNDPEKTNQFISKYSDRDDLQSSFDHKRHSGENVTHPGMPDFNALFQLGQQMLIPGMMGLPGISGVNNMGLGLRLGNDMFPSMQGMMSGGNQLSSSREREVRDYYEDRERRDCHDVRGNRREHNERRESQRNRPYDRHHNHWEDHKRHDRGYSSSHSTRDRERRDRRSH